jgi:diguanylate cyclase (GGDEF)-like protein
MPHSPGPSFARAWARARRAALLPLLLRPFQTLPSRIIAWVFGAAFVTSLAVTLVSTSSIESFLRQKADQKFPTVLHRTAERLELWYSQRRLDVETFGRSATLVENAALLREGRPEARRRAREEIGQYLAYVLDRFPQYAALFVLDAEGRELLWAGERLELSAIVRAELAQVASSRVNELLVPDGSHAQIASAPMGEQRGRLGSLHALVRLETLAPVFDVEDLGESGVVYAVARDGKPLVQSPGRAVREHWNRRPPGDDDAPHVEDYTSAGGRHVVGSSLGFPLFGWTLVVEQDYEEVFAPVVSVIRRILAINLAIVCFFGIVAYQFARSIAQPIQALSEGARRIAEGETDVSVPLPNTLDEIEVLTRVFNEMSQRLRRDQAELAESREAVESANDRLRQQNDELQRVNEVLEQLSITDGLTRLHNHRFFQDHLRREMRRARRTGEPLSLILVDIDNFKTLNDRYGHAVGDALLHMVAEVMNGAVRETDLLARYGGEEFALVASRTDLEGARALAEKLRLALSHARFPIEGETGEPVSVTVSVGVAGFRGDDKALFNDADKALYRAKAAGKDCVVLADEPSAPAPPPTRQRGRKREA